uniref:Uncharacterized protein n=1 Tax=Anguilla anguilla TaxID=7936 RepID=A0A0E9U909_ANGAN
MCGICQVFPTNTEPDPKHQSLKTCV